MKFSVIALQGHLCLQNTSFVIPVILLKNFLKTIQCSSTMLEYMSLYTYIYVNTKTENYSGLASGSLKKESLLSITVQNSTEGVSTY